MEAGFFNVEDHSEDSPVARGIAILINKKVKTLYPSLKYCQTESSHVMTT